MLTARVLAPILGTRETAQVQPETQYARSGEVHIAYQVVGEGELDLVWIPSFAHHVELSWENPPVARFLLRLMELGRLLLFDKRGTGMSDRVSSDTTLETRMDDIRAVMDAAGSERAVVCALGEGGPLAMLFAATYPERTDGLVLINSSPRLVRSAEFPWLPSRGEQEQNIEEMMRKWGSPGQRELLAMGNPDMAEDERVAFARALRLSVSPGAMGEYMRMNLDVDVRGVLDSIRVPTLVLHRTELARLDIRGARYLAEQIHGARLVELPGRNFAPAVGDVEALFAEIERFCADIRSGEWEELETDRMLATVLFTDIVGSTEKMAELGDRGWRELLDGHHTAVRRQLSRFRGIEMDTAGDGFFARFDGPARAIHCAQAITDDVREFGLDVRAGLHTGECELHDGKVAGIAVSIGARIAGAAEPGEVLVSSTVKDLVAGSGLGFEDRGTRELKGVPGEWRLYALER
jgi:class 3 adenylate cyclase/pimeloyl-ACP methyl ester carboxylesterase